MEPVSSAAEAITSISTDTVTSEDPLLSPGFESATYDIPTAGAHVLPAELFAVSAVPTEAILWEGQLRTMEPVTVSHKKQFEKFLIQRPQKVCEMTFGHLSCWNCRGVRYFTLIDGHLLVGFRKEGAWRFYQPIGPNPASLINRMPEFAWISIEEDVYQGLTCKDLFSFDRNNSDYLYALENMRTLPGGTYKKKRQYIHQTETLHPQVVTLNSMFATQCLAVAQQWAEQKQFSVTDCEALAQSLVHFDEIGFFGIGIFIGGKMEGFTFGEVLSPKTFDLHFAKTNVGIPCLYAYLLNAMAKALPSSELLNTEQDLGIPGLREAKERWHPVSLERKYTNLPL